MVVHGGEVNKVCCTTYRNLRKKTMEILTEFDGLQEALKKVKMDESVMPYVNGRLVDDSAWNKT